MTTLRQDISRRCPAEQGWKHFEETIDNFNEGWTEFVLQEDAYNFYSSNSTLVVEDQHAYVVIHSGSAIGGKGNAGIPVFARKNGTIIALNTRACEGVCYLNLTFAPTEGGSKNIKPSFQRAQEDLPSDESLD